MLPESSLERSRAGGGEAYRAKRIAHWDRVAAAYKDRSHVARSYHRRLERVYRFVVPAGSRVLEIGCGTGDLLAALAPEGGVGVDFSPAMLAEARRRYPNLQFVEADAHDLSALEGTFDIIVLSDLLDDVWDVQELLDGLHRLCHPGTRVVTNFFSRLWEIPLTIAARLKLARPVLKQNWLTVADIRQPVQAVRLPCDPDVAGSPVSVADSRSRPSCEPRPRTPVGDSQLGTGEFHDRTPAPASARDDRPLSVSVIVPARNEAGNIPAVFARTPQMGVETELIFVEGHSSDDTYGAIERAIAANSQRPARLLRQTGRGKGDAVRLGFSAARGDVLMILDADLTMPPEDLPRFYEALQSDKGEFVNGVRLTYPMEDRAMRFFNLLGNKFFSLAFSWLLGQPIKDTLCGTKVLRRDAYLAIASNRSYFGDFDPFGDFDLLFGAAKLGLELIELPIRYRERTYGTTNIRRWSDGRLLLKMCVFAAGRIKFV